MEIQLPCRGYVMGGKEGGVALPIAPESGPHRERKPGTTANERLDS